MFTDEIGQSKTVGSRNSVLKTMLGSMTRRSNKLTNDVSKAGAYQRNSREPRPVRLSDYQDRDTGVLILLLAQTGSDRLR